jgi:hypothetical protein
VIRNSSYGDVQVGGDLASLVKVLCSFGILSKKCFFPSKEVRNAPPFVTVSCRGNAATGAEIREVGRELQHHTGGPSASADVNIWGSHVLQHEQLICSILTFKLKCFNPLSFLLSASQ